jgi:hypothetical protein
MINTPSTCKGPIDNKQSGKSHKPTPYQQGHCPICGCTDPSHHLVSEDKADDDVDKVAYRSWTM